MPKLFEVAGIGWVERSETHRFAENQITMGSASLTRPTLATAQSHFPDYVSGSTGQKT
jgi:hypothetical protein